MNTTNKWAGQCSSTRAVLMADKPARDGKSTSSRKRRPPTNKSGMSCPLITPNEHGSTSDLHSIGGKMTGVGGRKKNAIGHSPLLQGKFFFFFFRGVAGCCSPLRAFKHSKQPSAGTGDG